MDPVVLLLQQGLVEEDIPRGHQDNPREAASGPAGAAACQSSGWNQLSGPEMSGFCAAATKQFFVCSKLSNFIPLMTDTPLEDSGGT